jgi:hypothetical protein
MVDERLSEFLCFGDGKGLDQTSMVIYRAIVAAFDREWLYRLDEDFHPMK